MDDYSEPSHTSRVPLARRVVAERDDVEQVAHDAQLLGGGQVRSVRHGVLPRRG